MRRATLLDVDGNKEEDISIHALHEESDDMSKIDTAIHTVFQSTLSMRRATSVLREELIRLIISIHALHEESDPKPTNSPRKI